MAKKQVKVYCIHCKTRCSCKKSAEKFVADSESDGKLRKQKNFQPVAVRRFFCYNAEKILMSGEW